jgi:hypothetical protein
VTRHAVKRQTKKTALRGAVFSGVTLKPSPYKQSQEAFDEPILGRYLCFVKLIIAVGAGFSHKNIARKLGKELSSPCVCV